MIEWEVIVVNVCMDCGAEYDTVWSDTGAIEWARHIAVCRPRSADSEYLYRVSSARIMRKAGLNVDMPLARGWDSDGLF